MLDSDSMLFPFAMAYLHRALAAVTVTRQGRDPLARCQQEGQTWLGGARSRRHFSRRDRARPEPFRRGCRQNNLRKNRLVTDLSAAVARQPQNRRGRALKCHDA
jgi:hypothetical protein